MGDNCCVCGREAPAENSSEGKYWQTMWLSQSSRRLICAYCVSSIIRHALGEGVSGDGMSMHGHPEATDMGEC